MKTYNHDSSVRHWHWGRGKILNSREERVEATAGERIAAGDHNLRVQVWGRKKREWELVQGSSKEWEEIRGQEKGFGCVWELHYFKKKFSKWDKMRLLFRNEDWDGGKERWGIDEIVENWKVSSGEWGKKNQLDLWVSRCYKALWENENVCPSVCIAHIVLGKSSVLSEVFMCCLSISVSLSLAFTCVTFHSYRSNLIFPSQEPHGQMGEMSETVKVTHAVRIPERKPRAAISINNSPRRFGKAPCSLKGIILINHLPAVCCLRLSVANIVVTLASACHQSYRQSRQDALAVFDFCRKKYKQHLGNNPCWEPSDSPENWDTKGDLRLPSHSSAT